MRINLSHRWRITIAAAGVAAALFALVFYGAHTVMRRAERRASEELLDPPMSEVLNSLKSGEPLDEEVGSQERVTVVVFDRSGTPTFRSGAAMIAPWQGAGEVSVGGRRLVYRSEQFHGATIVAAADWTEAQNRLARTALLFAVLVFPLALAVGTAAYVSAGMMYRPLRILTASARRIAAEGQVRLLEDPQDADYSPLVNELNALLERIRSEMQRQERLVSDVAHDLRTPLTVIRGRLETALLRREAEKYPEAMQIAIREAERLSGLADTILRAGEHRKHAHPIQVSALTDEIARRWEEIFSQRAIQFAFKTSECRSTITPEEWTSVVDNLLDNAFKYGGSECSLLLRSSGHTVELIVADNGPGIPVAEHTRVFERFTRLDSSRTSDGHGLGLYMCSTILECRGGGIGIVPSTQGLVLKAWLPEARRSATPTKDA